MDRNVSETLCNLPPLSAVATHVLQLSSNPDVAFKALADVIESDPAFAADVLNLANSALFGVTPIIQGLRQAIAIVGLERVRGLACRVAMRAFVGTKGIPHVDEFWQHSAACAVLAENLALLMDISGDRGYTAGLMHDVGRLGLLKAYPSDYDSVIRAEHDHVEDVLHAERASLGVDHCEAGAWLSRVWGLPESFEAIARHHHDALGQAKSDLLYVVQLACLLADSLGFEAIRHKSIAGFDEVVSGMPGWLQSRFTRSQEELRQTVEKRFEFLR